MARTRALNANKEHTMTEATATKIDLASFEDWVDKKIKLTYTMDNETLEAEGALLAVSSTRGVMFRKRGSQSPLLLASDSIVNIEALAEAPKKVTAKKLKAVTLSDARAHLADRHSYTLTVVNSATDEQALLAHQALDHTDLGHSHDDGTQTVSPAVASEATATE
jgi:hypothetical protein